MKLITFKTKIYESFSSRIAFSGCLKLPHLGQQVESISFPHGSHLLLRPFLNILSC